MDSLWKATFLENLVHLGLYGRRDEGAGGVGVRAELSLPNSPVFPGVYRTGQADVLSTKELKAELASRALPALPMRASSLYFISLKLIF